MQYFIDGTDIFPQIIDIIDSAQKSVYVEVFLFYDDESGRAIVNKLVEKAKAGLDVRVLLSAKGSEFNKSYWIFKTLRENHIDIVFTFPLPRLLKKIWDSIKLEQIPTANGEDETWECRVDETLKQRLSKKSQEISKSIFRKYDQAPLTQVTPSTLKRKRKKILRSIKFYDHRKIIVADNQRAFIGGMNFGNDYLFQGEPSEFGYFHDIGVLLEGDAVKEILKLFMTIWHLFSPAKIFLTFSRRLLAAKTETGIDITTISSFPKILPNPIRQAYLKEIREAKNSIYIINLYLTDNELIKALVEASQRGVDVHIVSTFLPTNSITSFFIRLLYKGYFYLIAKKTKMPDYGVHLHHYTLYNVHAKVAIIDDRWLTVGSSNLDYSSLRNAMEINITLTAPHMIESIKNNLFIKDIKNSTILSKRLSFFQKISYYICYKIFLVCDKYFI